MENFDFYNPVKILFGRNRIAELPDLIPLKSKVLVTYGGGSIFKNGVHEQIRLALNEYSVSEFGGIEPNPTHETAMRAVDLIRKEKIDFVLAVGGGSVIDASKYIVAAATFKGDPWEILSELATT